MRVLVTGLNQANFLMQLYAGIKQKCNTLYVGTTGLRIHGNRNGNIDGKSTFDKIYNTRPSPIRIPISVITLIFSRWFYQFFFYILVVEGKVFKAAHYCTQMLQEMSFYRSQKNFISYDVFHFHYMQYSYIKSLWLVPKGKKIICSFWGSDLLRTADNFNHYMVGKAMQRANIITVQSTELQEIVLAKYGRDLKVKIRVAQFSLSKQTFDLIDKYRGYTSNIEAFCKRFAIDFYKVKIVIGHNASAFNNHLPLIDALAKLPSKDTLFLIVPFAYGIAPGERQGYRNNIVQALNNCLIPYVVLDDYFLDDDLALLRLATDIFLHMPESDALSAALTETAYAGGLTITGDWLPYSPFKKAGMHLLYCAACSDVTATIAANLEDFIGLRQRMAHQNILAVQNNFFPTVTTDGWLKIFDELTPS